MGVVSERECSCRAAVAVVSLILVIGLLDNGYAQDTASLFQCQPTTDQSGHVFAPNIPDSYFNHTNALESTQQGNLATLSVDRETVFVFTTPPETTCNGTVLAFEFCYLTFDSQFLRTDREVFRFLSLNTSRDGFQFTVIDFDRVRINASPRETICSIYEQDRQYICCETYTLPADEQFQIPSSNYTSFGVVTRRNENEFRPLAFSGVNTKFRFPHFRGRPADNNNPDRIGETFTFTANDIQNEGSLLLLRLIIDAGEGLHFTTETDDAGEGGGSAVGGVVVVILLLLVVGVTVGVVAGVFIVWRRKAYTPHNTTITTNNGGDRYARRGPRVLVRNVKDMNRQQEVSDEHVYAETGACHFGTCHIEEGNTYEMEEEDIYQVPARDVNGLYSQLSAIRTSILTRDSVKLANKLGSGQFGVVYKGVWQSPSRGEVEVAVKTLKEGSGEEDRVKFLQEAAIMGQFRHPNVVTLYGVVSKGEPVLILLDLLSKGDLRGHLCGLRSEDGDVANVDDHTLLSYCRQVASGMTYLSNKAFVHRDLAARNILVSEDEICKIADFGMSRDLMDENYYVSHGGQIPIKWTAPEALHYKKYSTASDVWSYGALMYEIWSVGHKPFEGLDNVKVVRLVDSKFRLAPPPGCPRAIYAIMMSCWHPTASVRPDFHEVTQKLSLPDTKLLKWLKEDKSVHPEAAKLGADLLCGEGLYKDLQVKYKDRSK